MHLYYATQQIVLNADFEKAFMPPAHAGGSDEIIDVLSVIHTCIIHTFVLLSPSVNLRLIFIMKHRKITKKVVGQSGHAGRLGHVGQLGHLGQNLLNHNRINDLRSFSSGGQDEIFGISMNK